jgi:hypothetical protein
LPAVAEKAQGSQILKVALASTFYYRKDMIGIPESLACKALKPPSGEKLFPMGPARAP